MGPTVLTLLGNVGACFEASTEINTRLLMPRKEGRAVHANTRAGTGQNRTG